MTHSPPEQPRRPQGYNRYQEQQDDGTLERQCRNRQSVSQPEQSRGAAFCEICGLTPDEHPPDPPSGPPVPPQLWRPTLPGGVRRPPHPFTASKHTVAELMDERDGQIAQWRKRAYEAERKLEQIRKVTG